MLNTEEPEIKRDDGVNEALAGKVHGERWARKHATPGQLDAIAIALEPIFFIDPMHEVVAASIDEENSPHEFWEWLIDDAKPDDEFVMAFVEAALDVGDEMVE